MEQQQTFVKRDKAVTEEKLEEVRNMVAAKMNKWSSAISVSMAFTPTILRVEGERWEEEGKAYELKNGVKQSIPRMMNVRMPWWCPKCSQPMNHKYDRKFYYLRDMCYNCNIEFEGQMRINGTYEAFEKRIMRENEKAFIRDKLQEYRDYIEGFTVPTQVYEDGRWERLAPKAIFEQLFEEIRADGDLLAARLEVIAQEEAHELELAMDKIHPHDSSSSLGSGRSDVLGGQGAAA